jgi:SPX domain protein involved in polyphosphate accumulation
MAKHRKQTQQKMNSGFFNPTNFYPASEQEPTLATDNNISSSVEAPMKLQLEAQPMREMIQGFIKINQDILNISDLSSQQRKDLAKLGNELSNLGYQSAETKVKVQLLDIFNRLD